VARLGRAGAEGQSSRVPEKHAFSLCEATRRGAQAGRLYNAAMLRRSISPACAWLLPLLLAACAVSAEPDRSEQGRVRLVSYNVKHGLGMDGELDLERIARVLESLDPDIVLLQEIDVVCGRSGGVDQARALGERLGMDSRFAAFMDFDGGQYGLATLSRLEILDSQVIVLPPGTREPRSALIVTVQLGEASARVANAHLDWLKGDTERLAQARALRAELATPGAPVVLAGDLNDTAESATLAVFTSGESPLERLGPAEGTFPSDGPERTIDHVLVGPAGTWEITEVRVVDEKVASDHCPIVVDLRLLERGK